MNRKFKTQFQIHFREADPAGIMYFGNLPSLAHDAFEKFIVEAGYQWREWFGGKSELIPIRHMEVDYLAPFFPGQSYGVEVSVDSMSTNSFKMRYIFIGGGQICATISMVHAVLDAQTKQKKELPALMRERLSPYLEPMQ